MTEPAERRRPPVTAAQVSRIERITPRMIRVVLGGPGLAGFPVGQFTDHYIKLMFPVDGVSYPEPFDLARIRAELPSEHWPRTRTYTVRRYDPDQGELTFDLLYHGEVGLAGPWSGRVRPGDTVHFGGPGGAYTPSADADWHLLAGDESALPAIAASVERLPAGSRAHVFVEVSDPDEEQPLDSAADVTVTWLHRNGQDVGTALVRAVSALDFAPGTVQAFVHGEAGFVKELRRLLLVERAIPRDQVSISGYWRLGHDEDRWQATKRDWNREVEREQDPR